MTELMLITFAVFASECHQTRVKDFQTTKVAVISFIPIALARQSKITNVKDIVPSRGSKEPTVKHIILHFLMIYSHIYLKLHIATR